jgi:DNA-binding transcriptional MerR regulator
MNNVKSIFSIKDLENLSGIKAHTIRIWEKRYNILEPMRTDTNIRFYDVVNLQKLLNITLLHNYGYKISKISRLPSEKIPALVNEIISEKSIRMHALNAFKMAMMNFDHALFYNTYNSLLSEKSFRDIFYEVLIPLMEEIGILWQTNTITPAHEHFISNLVRQKILSNSEKIQSIEPIRHEKVFVLFLPENEIHEIGLIYINYELARNGYKAIFLGGNVPVENLKDVGKYFENIVYVSYFTVSPPRNEVQAYLDHIDKEILDGQSELWILGRNTTAIQPENLSKRIRMFDSIEKLVNQL